MPRKTKSQIALADVQPGTFVSDNYSPERFGRFAGLNAKGTEAMVKISVPVERLRLEFAPDGETELTDREGWLDGQVVPQAADAPPTIEDLWSDYHQARRDGQSATEQRNRIAVFFYPWLKKFVASWSRKHLPPQVTGNEVFGHAAEALLWCVERFEPERGIKFTSFAVRRLVGAMRDAMRQLDYVPRLVRWQVGRASEAADALEQRLGHAPNAEELSEIGSRNWRGLVSLHEVPNQNHGSQPNTLTFEELLADDHATDPTSEADRKRFVSRVCRTLNPQETVVVYLYYFRGCTMKQLGALLGLSESRVSQMHAYIMRRLSESLDRDDEFEAARGWRGMPAEDEPVNGYVPMFTGA